MYGRKELSFNAEDLKLNRVVSSVDDCTFIHRTLQLIFHWSEKLNSSKYQPITFARCRKVRSFTYSRNGINLEKFTSLKDLGEDLDSKIDFKFHIYCTITYFRSIPELVRDFNDNRVTKALYCSLVRLCGTGLITILSNSYQPCGIDTKTV